MSGKDVCVYCRGTYCQFLKNLDNGLGPHRFHDTAIFCVAVLHVEFHDFLVRCVFLHPQGQQEGRLFHSGKIFDCHKLIPPLTVSFQYIVVETVDIFMIFIKTLRLFIWNLVFDGDDTFKILSSFSTETGCHGLQGHGIFRRDRGWFPSSGTAFP